MPRSSYWILFALALGLVVPGCTNLMARRAIERFSESLQAQNLDKLKATTSGEFDQMALRQPEALGDLKLLKIPTGDVKIEKVEKLEDGTKKVIAKIGDKKNPKEVEYRIALNRKTGRWVVDDIIMKQDSGKGIVEKSLTEQMNLLLCCREFLTAWKEGSRADKLAYCEPSLRSELETLPPTWLNKLAEEIVGNGRSKSYRPDARTTDDRSVVVIPHPDGDLFLEMKQSGDQWLVSDLAVEPSSKSVTGIRSARKIAKSLNRSAEFLTAYAAENREVLQQTSSRDFYEKCLSGADLKEIELPVPTLLSERYDARQFPDRVELILKGPQSTYMLTLKQIETDLVDGTKGNAETRIDDVTIFEKDGKEVKRFSAVFVTHSIVSLYLDALRSRELIQLKKMSSNDFNDRVWNRPEASHFAIMPEPEIASGEPEIISTVFRGDVSEVTLAVGDSPMTVVLTSSKGWMVVDDVIMPALNRPTSLKLNLEIQFSLHAFAAAAGRGSLPELIQYSADGLDRIVWRQLDQTPELAKKLVRPLMSEVVSVEMNDPWTKVTTSDGITQAEVFLIKEGTRYVVHDLVLVSEANPEHRVEWMATMRRMIADGEIGPLAKRRHDIQQARAELSVEQLPARPKAESGTRESEKSPVFEPIDRALYTK